MKHKWLAVMAAATLLLSACGFYLKGHQDYAFKRLYVASSGTTSAAMVSYLKRLIQASGKTILVTNPKQADATLFVGQDRNRNTLSINVGGLVDEYELVLRLDYSLISADGAVLIPPSSLVLNRAMTYGDQFVLAKDTEADLLYRDMEKDAADQLIRRLAALRSLDANDALPVTQPGAPLPPLF